MSEGEGDGRCEVNPATRADLDWIFQLQIDAYSRQYAISRQKLDQWFGRNPDGFSVVRISGHRVGHLTLVPLRANALESFVLGKLAENEIHEDGIHPPEEKHLIRNLYVESIILDPQNGHYRLPIQALTSLAIDFVPLIRRVCDPNNLENFYALSATGRGERLMKALGFNQVKRGHRRPDQRALYAATFRVLTLNITELYNRRRRHASVNRDLPSSVPC